MESASLKLRIANDRDMLSFSEDIVAQAQALSDLASDALKIQQSAILKLIRRLAFIALKTWKLFQLSNIFINILNFKNYFAQVNLKPYANLCRTHRHTLP